MRSAAIALLVLAALAIGASASVLAGGCSNAVYIPPPYNGQDIFGNTQGYPSFANGCAINTGTAGTAFYVISPTVGSIMNITTCHVNTNYASALAVFVGDDCDDLHCITSSVNAACSSTSGAATVGFTASASTYWIMVSGNNGAEGQYDLSITEQGNGNPGSGCSSAITIQGPYTTPITLVGSVSGSSTESQPCGANSNTIGNWYEIFPNLGDVVTVTTCNNYPGLTDTIIAIIEGSCTTHTCTTVSDDDCDQLSTLSTAVFTAEQSQYYIYVTGAGSSNGTFELTISEEAAPPPPSGNGNSCISAIYISQPGTYTGFSNSQGDYLINPCGESREGLSTWFEIQPPVGSTVTVSTCSAGTDFDTEIAVYTSCETGSSCQIFEDDDGSCHYSTLDTTATFYAYADTYWIAVLGYSTSSVGQFDFIYDYTN